MAKNLQVNLAFTADTNAAMSNLQKLRTSLNEISSINFNVGNVLNKDLKSASVSAQQLQQHLGQAMDVKTGNLNLSKFEASLKNSNLSLSSLTANLLKAGTVGEQAFLSTYQAIAQSNLQLKSSNTLLSSFMVTLKNTAKWQLSSSLLHGLISGFRDAIGYAKELNSSLNNIQIVTGYSSEYMADFAKQAQKAAKELRTTTTAYTDAALIYYQQGLSGDAVKQRTDTTVKLANVTKESAETVSEWMTAIWNNFDDGSKSLEYYADVIAKLGAETASSADEIAQGFEKFAAVADTVGLSYEYGASALAAVTSQTRQSADIVGTAFKTLFARIQDLDLGNTLDDGTTLGSYSEALNKVGVNIKTTSGELKSMDVILDEMGNTWDTLGNDQQVALAKSVAGIRQYTQLIALMDNYDYFKQLTESANESEGALEAQTLIYEQSWEAAGKNVKTSMEGLYSTLIPEDAFIDFTNGIAEAVSGFTSLIDAAGGLKTILLLLANVVMSKFSTQMAMALDTGKSKLDNLIGGFIALKTEKGSTAKAIGSMVKTGFSNIKPIKNLSTSVQDFKQQSGALMASGKQSENFNRKAQIYSTLSEDRKATTNKSENFDSNIRKQDIYNRLSEKNQQKFSQTHDIAKWSGSEKVQKQGAIDDKQTQKTNELLQQRTASQKDYQLALQKAATTEQNMSAGFKDQISSLQQIEKHTTAIGNLTNKMSTSEKEVFSSQLEQLRVLGEKKAEQSQIISDLKLETELLKDAQALDFDRSKFTRNTKSERYEYSGERAFANLDEDGRSAFAKATLEASANEAHVSVNESGGTVSFENLEAAKVAQQEILGIVEKTKQVSLEVSDINSSDNSNLEQRKSVLSEIINKAESEGLISKKTAASMREQVNNSNDVKTISAQIEKRFKNIHQGASAAADAMGVGADKIKQANKNGAAMFQAQKKRLALTQEENNLNNTIAQNIGKIAQRTTSFGTMFTKGIQGASQFAMGLNMVSGALNSIKENGIGLESISSILMAAATFIPALTNGFSAAALGLGKLNTQYILNKALSTEKNMQIAKEIAMNYVLKASEDDLTDEQREQILTENAQQLAKATGMTVDAAKIALTKTKIATDKAGNAVTNEGTAAIIANALATMSHPIMWIVAIIVAVIAAVTILIALIASSNKTLKENSQQVVDNSKANIELINSTQELAQTVSDLTDKYKDLKVQGKDTYETLKELKDQIPKLIDEYQKLEGVLNIDLGIENLEAAYKVFEETGNIEQFEKVQEEIDSKVSAAKLGEAQRGAEAAATKMIEEAASGDGKTTNTTYEVTIGGTSTQTVKYKGESMYEETAASKVLEDVMGDMWDGSKIEFDTTTASGIMEGYEKMAEAKAKMEQQFTAEQLSHMDTYRELKREIEEMSEDYEQLAELQSEVYTAASEDFTANNGAKANEILNEAFGEKGIQSIDQYKNKREELIQTLKDEYDITEAQAESLLAQSDAFSNFELAIDLFAEDGKIGEALKTKGNLALSEVQSWYENLPEKDRTLFMGIDFNTVDNLDEAKEKLEELREEARRNSIEQEAIASDIDASQLKMYSAVLAQNNDELETNSSLTDQIALDNLKLNKGLTTLQDSWEDNYKILKSTNKLTPEYAQALGEVHDALEEAFGVSVSSDYIEENLETINQLASGDISVLQELQDKMAEDYVANMEISNISLTGEEAVENIDGVREQLTNMLNELDTSIEVGEGTTLSQDYLDTMQSLLDSGQVTEQQLQEMFRAKGYEFKVTGYKEVDGPKKTITQTIKGGGFLGLSDKTIVTEQQEKIQVPIVNGEGDAVSGKAAPASVIKSVTDANINNTIGSDKLKEKQDSSREKAKEIKNGRDPLFEEKEAADALAKSFDRISKAKEHAYGSDKLALGKQERANLEQQIKSNERLIKGYEKLADAKKKTLMNEFGAQFDINGNMSNYEEILKTLGDRVIAAAGNDEAEEAAQETYDNFVEYYEKYNEYRDSQWDKEQDNIDKRAEIIQSRLDDIDYTLEIKLEIEDSELDDLERRISLLDRGNNWDIANIMSITDEQAQIYTNKSSDYLDAARSVLKGKGLSKKQINKIMSGDAKALKKAGLSPEELETFQGYIQSAKDESRSGLDAVYDGLDKMGEYREGLIEDIDELASKIGDFKSQLDALSTIADLTGKNTGKVAENLRKASAEAAKANTAIAKTKYEALTSQAADLQAEIDKTTDETSKAILQQQLDNINSQIPGALADFYSAVADEMQVQIDNYNAQLKETLDGMSKDMFGMTSSDLKTAYDRQKEIKELYLTEYEKTYELNKLTRKLQSEIDKTDNTQSQKQLNHLLEKANLLYSDDVKLSKNQLTLLEKEIEAEKALIALEEGRNAKSQVQLQRNALGGYSYVYTANKENVANLQQAYEDSMHAYNEALNSMVEDSEGMIVQIYGEWEEALLNLDTSAQDYEQKMDEVNQHYTQLLTFYTGQVDWALGQSNSFINRHAANYSGNLDQMEVSTNNWLSSFNQTFLGSITKKDSAQGILEDWVASIGTPDEPGTVIGTVKSNFDLLQGNLNDILVTNMGTTLDKFEKGFNGVIGESDKEGIRGKINDTTSETDALKGKFDELAEVDLSEWSNSISEELGAIETAASNAAEAIKKLKQAELEEGSKNFILTDTDNKNAMGKGTVKKGAKVFTMTSDGTIKEVGDTATFAATTTSKGGKMTFTGRTASYTTKDGKTITLVENSNGNWYSSDAVDFGGNKTNTPPGGDTTSTTPDGAGEPPLEGEPPKDENKEEAEDKDEVEYYNPKGNKKIISGYDPAFQDWEYELKSKNKKVSYKTDKNADYLLNEAEIKGYNSKTKEYLVKLSGTMGQINNFNSYSANPYFIRNGKLLKLTPREYYKTYLAGKERWIGKNAINWYNSGNTEYFSGNKQAYELYKMRKYDTGGYTGSWGPEGKLAMLHQKEIVLNASDTANFLEAIKLVRQIASQIDLQAASMSSSAFANILSTFNVSGSSDTLDQNVTIHAEFPNVTQHTEIEQAFENLINKASQFANRR